VDDLTRMLRSASDDAPPTAIDIDGLIAGERHRRRRSRFTVAAAAGGVAAVAVAASFLVDRPEAPSPMPAPAASASAVVATVPCNHNDMPSWVPKRPADPVRPPAESRPAALLRLDRALPAVLPRDARPMTGTGCDHIEFWWSEHDSRYNLGALLPGPVSLAIMVEARDRGDVPQCVAVPDDCHRTDAPDGSVILSDLSDVSDLNVGDQQRTVTVDRPDDTRVMIAVIGQYGDLPTVETLSRIGLSPELTLYP
jgi:hypothetical protein